MLGENLPFGEISNGDAGRYVTHGCVRCAVAARDGKLILERL